MQMFKLIVPEASVDALLGAVDGAANWLRCASLSDNMETIVDLDRAYKSIAKASASRSADIVAGGLVVILTEHEAYAMKTAIGYQLHCSAEAVRDGEARGTQKEWAVQWIYTAGVIVGQSELPAGPVPFFDEDEFRSAA